MDNAVLCATVIIYLLYPTIVDDGFCIFKCLFNHGLCLLPLRTFYLNFRIKPFGLQ